MRLLLIHDADEMRSHIAQQLLAGAADLELTFWDPSRHGSPAADYCAAFDVIILDEHPGDSYGLDFIATWHRSGVRLPPTLLLCGSVTDETSTAARRAGVDSCLAKAQISPAKIAGAIRAATKGPSTAPPMAGATVATSSTETTRERSGGRSDAPLRIAGYRISRRIGAGGAAQIYLAERESDGREVVIKLLDPRLHQDQAFRQQFARDYAILRRIAHHHVVAIFYQTVNERFGYIIMEHLPAGDLLSRIGVQGMSTDAAMLFLAQIARALDATHRAGLVHRALKPQNILFRNDLQLVLVDFGLARDVVTNARGTQRGTSFGMPFYMSPEQCIGAAHDERGDLYSLGAVFFHMLTGRPPYVADDAADLAFQHVHGTLARLPPKLAGYQPLVNRLLAKKPEHRPASAAQLLSDIKQSK